jgi:chemotaxis protein histidine kinase CheA
MVWEQKLVRAKRDGGSLEWIVMRNRLSNIDARNKRYMKKVTEELSRRIGFRLAPGFSERVIFREMFLQGLTVLDVMEEGASRSVSLSHIAARQEVRDLLKTLRIPEIDRRVSELRQREEMEEDARSSAKEAPKPAAKPEPEVAKAAAQTSEAKAEEPATAAPAETAAAAETPAPSAQPAQQPAAATAAYHDNPMVRESSPLDYSTRQPASAGS